MANLYNVYKCNKCSNVVMKMKTDDSTMSCCDLNMIHMPEQTADSTKEKHVPVIEKTDAGYRVTVGSTPHPMLENHWIQWIELVINGSRMITELNPGDDPSASFNCKHESGAKVTAREYCNLHGLWKGNL